MASITETLISKKSVMFTKNPMPKKTFTKSMNTPKSQLKSKTAATTTTMTTLTPKVKIKTEPATVIVAEGTSEEEEAKDRKNVTEIDTGLSKTSEDSSSEHEE